MTDAVGNHTFYQPDALGRTVATVDDLGHVNRTIFDALGRPHYVLDAQMGKTTYEYDAAGNLVMLIDPVGNQTSWEYDGNGNVTKETDPNLHVKTWEYDDANRVISYADRLGRQKIYTYYDNNLLHTEVWKTSAGGTTVNTITYTYNENGQLLTANDNSGTITNTYDALGRLYTVTDVWTITLTNTYDAADRKTQVADSKGGTKNYVYDDADRLTQVKYSDASSQLRFDFTYSNRNQVTQIDRYTDLAATTKVSLSEYAYDDAGKVTSITHKNGAGTSTIDSFTYTWNVANQITQEVSSWVPTTKNYTLDANGQVTGDGTSSFTYDANGNRTMSGYVITAGNRVTTDGAWNYTYDYEGNMTSQSKISTTESWLYTYDNNNRLTKAEHKATSGGSVDLHLEYAYDAFGNRIQKSLDSDGDGSGSAVLTKFAYDGPNAWADMDSSLAIQTRRVYTDAIDAYFARLDSSGNEVWPLTDNLGSVRDIVNSTGGAIDHIDYATFGKVCYESSSSNGDRYKFTSREFDAETPHLGYYRRRWYQLDIAGWMSEDPIGFKAGDANLRRYVSNNPTTLTDALGTFARDRNPHVRRPYLGLTAPDPVLAAYEAHVDPNHSFRPHVPSQARGTGPDWQADLGGWEPSSPSSHGNSRPGVALSFLGGALMAPVEMGAIIIDVGGTTIQFGSNILGTGNCHFPLLSSTFSGNEQAHRMGQGDEYECTMALNSVTIGGYGLYESASRGHWDRFAFQAGGYVWIGVGASQASGLTRSSGRAPRVAGRSNSACGRFSNHNHFAG